MGMETPHSSGYFSARPRGGCHLVMPFTITFRCLETPQRLRKPTEVHVNPSQSFVPWHCLSFLKSSMLSALPTTMQMGNITRPIVQAGKQRLRETKVHSFQSAGPWAGSSSPGNFQSRVRPTATEAPEQCDTSLNKSCR